MADDTPANDLAREFLGAVEVLLGTTPTDPNTPPTEKVGASPSPEVVVAPPATELEGAT